MGDAPKNPRFYPIQRDSAPFGPNTAEEENKALIKRVKKDESTVFVLNNGDAFKLRNQYDTDIFIDDIEFSIKAILTVNSFDLCRFVAHAPSSDGTSKLVALEAQIEFSRVKSRLGN